LQRLFALFDKNGNQVVDIEEFVESQRVLVEARGEVFDKSKEVATYFDLSLSGPLDFDEFSRWWLEIVSERCHCSGPGRPEAEVAAIEDACHALQPGTPTSPAGMGASAARGLRAGVRCGGTASLSKGFVEYASDVHEDIDSFEEHLKAVRRTQAAAGRSASADISRVAGMLRAQRRKRRNARTAKEAQAARASERALTEKLRKLWQQLRKERAGKLVLKGTVNSKGRSITGAAVELSSTSEVAASTASDGGGAFEISVKAQLGRGMSLKATREGFAEGIKRVGGQGVRSVRFELLPLTVRGQFKAAPGKQDVEVFRDTLSGARFEVPVGEIFKDGRPWGGPTEFSAAVVDVSSSAGLESMPPLTGRSMAGAVTPMQSVGCVFVALKDPSDGGSLTLMPRGTGIEATLPSKAPLPTQQPSVWRYLEEAGEWEQTLQTLAVNGSELSPPSPDEEASAPVEALDEALTAQQESAEKELQAGREQLDKQRSAAQQEKICTCGYESKMALLSLIRAVPGLELTDPPKRVFAATEAAPSGQLNLSFPYTSEADRAASVQKAADHPEVALSHHLLKACEVLGRPWGAGSQLQNSLFYLKEAREALPSLRFIAEWLAGQASARDRESGKPADQDVDPALFPLKVLDKLAGFWAQGREDYSVGTPGPTLEEMRIALEDCCGDVAEALLLLARDQARRSEVAGVRGRLREEDAGFTARFHQVDRALDDAGRNVQEAAAALLQDQEVTSRLAKLRVREQLFKAMPMAHPSSRQVESAIREADGDAEKAASLLQESPAVQEGAKEVYKTWRETLETVAEGGANNTFTFQILDTGWNNLDAPAKLPPDDEEPPRKARPSLEFFPPAPKPLCPAGDSSIALGTFDDDVFASRASALDLTYRGVDFSEDVQPDGTFSLCVLGSSRFEVKTTKSDGTSSYSFGPFLAARRREVTHLGLLSRPRDNGASWEQVSVGLDIVLPALEFPPHGASGSGGEASALYAKWLGTWTWDEDDGVLQQMAEDGGLPKSYLATFTLTCDEQEEGETDDRADSQLRFTMGDWTGRGSLELPDEVDAEVLTISLSEPEPSECCPRAFLRMDGETPPDTALFSFMEDPCYDEQRRQRRELKVRRVSKDMGERCTCFDEDYGDDRFRA